VNFYSSDEYLGALATVWFPGRRCEAASYVVEGRQFRLLWREGLGPFVTFGPRADACNFLDFFEPLASAPDPAAAARPVRWLPRVALGAHEITSVAPEPLASGCTPAPYVDWLRFPQWSAFEAHVASRRPSLRPDAKRKRRRLEERLGPLEFRWDDDRPSAFETALAWKSEQYARSKVLDCFSIPQNVAMFRELRRRGLVIVSSLSAGERLVAVHLGALWRGRFSYWVPAYDREVLLLSPGRLLLDDMLRESHARGHVEFDFLLGDESYKYHYATHQRVVGSIGKAPFQVSLHDAVRASVKSALARYPSLREKARALENAFTRRSSSGGPPASEADELPERSRR
jgi:CelD/BcsL family acetyltransferase involved in cellulose biosynthesis